MRFSLTPLFWSIAIGITAWLLFFLKPSDAGTIYTSLMIVALIASVLAAVHNAEVVAHRIGEPYGTLVLAIAVTIIEVALIVSLMLSGGPGTETLARDTVFAAVMIILTGIIGLSLLIGGLHHKEQRFGKHGVNAALVTLIAITVLTLILPNYTTSISGPTYNKTQMIFVAAVSLVLYLTFVFVQAVRHRDYFLPKEGDTSEEVHAEPPSKQTALMSTMLLLVS